MRSDSCLPRMPSAKLMSSGTTGVSRIPTLHSDGGAGVIRTLGKKTPHPACQWSRNFHFSRA